MNNPNPFVPKGSLLEQQSQRRSRLKLAVFCVLAVSVTGLVAMLIQGCKREKPDTELTPPPLDLASNTVPLDVTNTSMMDLTNPPVVLPLAATNPPVMIAPVEPVLPVVTGSEYVVTKGDTLDKIGKKFGVSARAIETANPGVVPTRLKIGQKLTIPAGGAAASGAMAPAALTESSDTTYAVKSGDTLTTIAKKHGTTVKAIEAANGLNTTKIKVGQKLKIPSKAVAAPAPAPVVEPAPVVLPPMSAPATTAPAPAQ
jgi:LysM repeat protein